MRSNNTHQPFRLAHILNYRFKLVIGILLVIIPMLLILTFNRMVITRSLIYQRELERINTLGQILADEISENVVAKDTADLRDILSIAAREPSVQIISVIDSHDTVRFSNDTSLRGESNPFQESEDIDESGDCFFRTFRLPNIPTGAVSKIQIGYSLIEAKNDIQRSIAWALLLDTLIIASTIWIAWMISGVLIRPLYDMKRAAYKMAVGKFDTRIPVQSNDIIGQLAIAFNNMATELDDLTSNMQSRINNATQELIESNKRLKELDQLKTDFVIMVSHELRTPLTSIIGFAKTLLRLDLPRPERDNYIRIIENEGKRVSFLIEEYLDVSKIESGNFSLHLEHFNLYELAREVADTPYIDKKKPIQIKFDRKEMTLVGDRERLRRVLINILDNAMKYGGEHIELAGESHNSTVRITIRDTGLGIAKDDREKIFEKFVRCTVNNLTIKGTGLGLTIARGIIEAHGGSIRCESEIGKGTSFVIELPRQPEPKGA